MPQLSAEVSGGAEGGKKRRQLWFHVGGAPGSVVVSAARPAVEHCGTLWDTRRRSGVGAGGGEGSEEVGFKPAHFEIFVRHPR